MTIGLKPTTALETKIEAHLRKSVGQWRSERRYYTLPAGETQEVVSILQISFLEHGCPELIHLAQLHHLTDSLSLACGASVSWQSEYTLTGKQGSTGQTLFGVQGDVMYRDRGFATHKPVTALFHMPNADTLCLRTEYQKSVFEEEMKLIGDKYRTRQTVISKAGEQIMIGQYLEKRLEI